MKQLPNGCSCSDIHVFPKNWNTKSAKVNLKWYLYYRFYDASFRNIPKYKNGILVVVKAGLNRVDDLKEKQAIVKTLVESEWRLLSEEGYNPITKKIGEKEQEINYAEMPLAQALRFALARKTLEPRTSKDIGITLKFFEAALHEMDIATLPVGKIERKHMKQALDVCGRLKTKWNGSLFNHYRKYISILFSELMQYDAISYNPMVAISKMKETHKARKLLTQTERMTVDNHLKKNYYNFWRFLQIFFHSGARETEMVSLKLCDVDLELQRFKVTVKKGRSYREVYKPIKNIVMPLWKELVDSAKPGEYLFGKDLVPGVLAKPIRAEQITRRWKRHVKDKLGIEADFYSLKHLNTDETAALLGLEAAAQQNSHTSTVITLKHYALGEKGRQMERLKKVGNKFA